MHNFLVRINLSTNSLGLSYVEGIRGCKGCKHEGRHLYVPVTCFMTLFPLLTLILTYSHVTTTCSIEPIQFIHLIVVPLSFLLCGYSYGYGPIFLALIFCFEFT